MSSAPGRYRKPITILVADDDADDRLMISEAFEQSQFAGDLRFVNDGEELVEYLFRRGVYRDPQNSPRPRLIILDLNMPKKDGRSVLAEIRANSDLRSIPVVVLTTSGDEEEIRRMYQLGANSFISKPVDFEALVAIAKDIGRYWFEIVELPSPPPG